MVAGTNPTAQRGVQGDRGTPDSTVLGSVTPIRTDAPAKVRILATADRLFYEEGIRTVGIDRLIGESNVTKATFYKHWGSKDRLILQYLRGRHRAMQLQMEELEANLDHPATAIRSLIVSMSSEIDRPGFRGCPFINASAEYSDPTSPARQLVSAHREWYTDTLMELLRNAGHPLPGDAADELMLARDGAMVGGYAGDPVSAIAALRRTVERVLRDAKA